MKNNLLKFWFFVLCLVAFISCVSIACVEPIFALPDADTNSAAYRAPVPGSAPTSTPTPELVMMTVCGSGGWLHIRPDAGDLSRSEGTYQEGADVTVIGKATVTEDMGLWRQVDNGWVNARYLCYKK